MELDDQLHCQQTVLLLRNSPGNTEKDPYLKAFKSKELRTMFAPILSFEFSNEGVNEIVKYLENQCSFSGIIFTSKNAVTAFEKAVNLTLFDMQHILTGTDVFVVGKATGKSIDKWTTKHFGSSCGNANELSDFMIEFYKEKHLESGSPFLFPCGEMALSTLPNKLLANRILLKQFIVYETVKHADFETVVSDCMNVCLDAILFFSSSGVRFSFDAVIKLKKLNHNIKLVAFGVSTGKEIERCFSKCDGIAAHPTPNDACNAVLKALENDL